MGPGHCAIPGVIEVRILQFEAAPNATVHIRIDNRFGGVLYYGQSLFIQTVGNAVTYEGLLRNESWPKVNYKGMEEGESRVEKVKLGPIANVTWREMTFDFTYSRWGSSGDNFSVIVCPLDGDNAPWAFETEGSRRQRQQHGPGL